MVNGINVRVAIWLLSKEKSAGLGLFDTVYWVICPFLDFEENCTFQRPLFIFDDLAFKIVWICNPN
jgi:hypothetical protein